MRAAVGVLRCLGLRPFSKYVAADTPGRHRRPVRLRPGKNAMFHIACAVLFFALAVTLITRAVQGKFLSQLLFFYSYLAYSIVSVILVWGVYIWSREHYTSVAWVRLLSTVIAEFAVLVEISDHIFSPYPAIRRMGRFITFCICGTFFFLYILPSLGGYRSSSVTFLDFVKRTSLTKATIIVLLLAAVRYFRLPLGKNIAGMMLGFSIYLGINIANFALAETYGPLLYGRVLSVVLSLSSILCLLVWTVSMWKYEPAPTAARRLSPGRERLPEPLGDQLGRFNATLTKFLEK